MTAPASLREVHQCLLLITNYAPPFTSRESAIARRVADCFGGAFAFLDDQEHIHGEIREGFFQAAGPPDFERVHAGAIAEAEEDARVLCGHVAHAAFRLVIAGEVACDEFQVRADAVAI